MKVLSTFSTPGRGAIAFLINSFLDYLPEGMSQTSDPMEADVCFVHVMRGGLYAPLSQVGIEEIPLDLTARDDIEATFAHLKRIVELPYILYFDKFGVSRDSVYPNWVREIDIPIAPVTMPDHPNAYSVHFTDERRFYISHRSQRVPKSLILLRDQFEGEGIPAVLASLLQKKLITKITVAGTNQIDFSTENMRAILPYQDAIEIVSVNWPDGVRLLLNTGEFFLTTQPRHGIELMGIEAGFCGCQPIYPDTPYYRDGFSGTDIDFFDVENPEPSLEEIFSDENHHWDAEKRERFVERCSGTRHLPKFWEHVFKVLQS